MTQTLNAIFENGVFRPLTAENIPIPEGQKVWLVVEPIEPTGDALGLATQVYHDLSEQQIEEIEQVILNRHDFFMGRSIN